MEKSRGSDHGCGHDLFPRTDGTLEHARRRRECILSTTVIPENYMKANPGATPKQIAEQLENISKAGESNPTMGNNRRRKISLKRRDVCLPIKVGRINAATLPPGYMYLASLQRDDDFQWLWHGRNATRNLLNPEHAQSQQAP